MGIKTEKLIDQTPGLRSRLDHAHICAALVIRQAYEAWLQQLDDFCFQETGLNYADFPDQCFKAWFDDDLTPQDAYYRLMEGNYPGVEIDNVYTQEFDNFSDADPGL